MSDEKDRLIHEIAAEHHVAVDEAALKKAEEARSKARDKQELAVVEGELSSLAAQLAAIRKLRKK